MSLENLLRIGKLKALAADEQQIARLLESAERVIRDAEQPGMSSDTRMTLAYRGLMQAALAALRAKGYRPTTSEPGHHQLVIQVLPLTLGVPATHVQVLDAYRKARNQADYRGSEVSDAVARECIEDARVLLMQVRKIVR